MDPRHEQQPIENPTEASVEGGAEQAVTDPEAGSDGEGGAEDGADDFDWLEESLSEAELRGDVSTDSDEPGANDDPDPSRPSGEEEDGEQDPAGEGEPKGDDPKDDPKPEDGAGDDDGGSEAGSDDRTVPLKALQAERQKRQEAQSRLAELETQLAQRQQPQQPSRPAAPVAEIPDEMKPEVEAFKKAHPQYADMATEATPEGDGLRDRLENYGAEIAADYARGVSMERKMETEQQNTRASYDSEYLGACAKELHGLFPEGSATGETAGKAVEFADTRGLTPDTIGLLTNPSTVLLDPNTGQQVYLGRRAVEFAGFVKDSYDGHLSADPDAMRAQIEAELRESITADVTKQLTDKLKGGERKHRSIADAPGSAEQPGVNRTLTEAEYDRLSEEEQERYLMGE